MRDIVGKSVRALAAVWTLFGLVAVAIVFTYSRIPAAQLYHVSGHGVGAGLGRAVVFLNFPVALAALPIVALAVDRLRHSRTAVTAGVVSAGLCAVVFWPGVVDQANLDVRPVNALPAAGVGLAVALALAAGVFAVRSRVSVAAAVGSLLLLVLALPWIAADLGFYFDRVPVLERLFLTGMTYQGEASVHHGHHHGMDGVLLTLAALAAVPVVRQAVARPLRTLIGIYLGLQLAYGLANVANDAWYEQVVKRGWVGTRIPSVLNPTVSFAWLGIALAAVVFALAILRRPFDRPPHPVLRG